MGRKPKHYPSFFKVLIGDFASKLRIPPAFVAKLESELPTSALIEANSGESWDVKIEQIGEDHCFTHDGWQKLVKNKQLRFGDFVVFRLISKSVFDIVTYGPSGCEKEINPAAIKTQKNPFMARTSRPRKFMESPSHPYGRRSSGRVLDAGGSSSASAKPTDPSFLMVLRNYRRYRLSVPKAFAVETGIARKKSVVLRNNEGQLWAVEIFVRPYPYCSVDLTAGWSDFIVDNNIKLGDKCLFKFIQSSGNVIHVEVLHKVGRRRYRH